MWLIPFLLFSSQTKAVEEEARNWQDEIIYSITIDRFYNGDVTNDHNVSIQNPLTYQGGDFKGIIEKLDYIKDLGFTTISLSPIIDNETDGYHGYWPQDFYETEEHFGTIEEFKQLVQAAHEKNIKVIVDLPITHIATTHEWLADPEKADWYTEAGEDGVLVTDIPQLLHETPEVEQYLIEMAKWWVSETDIDGYRLVNAHIPSVAFWERFSAEVKKSKEDLFLISDRMVNDDLLDASGDYSFYEEASSTFREVDQSLDELYQISKQHQTTLENPFVIGNFIDNDQTVRFTRELIEKRQNPETRLKLALTYLYGAPGIPMIYYGTEIALDGGQVPDNHRMMAFRADKVIVDYMTKLAEIRKHHSSLRHGDFELIFNQKGMAVFKRTFEEESTIIAINNASETITADIPVEVIGENQELRALLSDEIVRANEDRYLLVMDRETANIFMLHEQTGINWMFIIGMVGVWSAFGIFIYLVKRKSKSAGKDE